MGSRGLGIGRQRDRRRNVAGATGARPIAMTRSTMSGRSCGAGSSLSCDMRPFHVAGRSGVNERANRQVTRHALSCAGNTQFRTASLVEQIDAKHSSQSFGR